MIIKPGNTQMLHNFNLEKYPLAKIAEIDSNVCQAELMHFIKYCLITEIYTLTDDTDWLFYLRQLLR